MIGTAREIALEMFRHSDLDGEKYVFACWNRNDIRCVCLDWDLTDEELDEVLRRLSSCLESGADTGGRSSGDDGACSYAPGGERNERRRCPGADHQILCR